MIGALSARRAFERRGADENCPHGGDDLARDQASDRVGIYDESLSGAYGVSPGEAGAHAGKNEASMMLALEGDLVKTDTFAPDFLGSLGEKEIRVIFEKGMPVLSSNGVLGDPRQASAAKEETYLKGFADFIIAELGLKPAG